MKVKQLQFYPALIIATVYGLALALYDITRGADYGYDLAYMSVAAALGFLRPKNGLLSALILSFCLYEVHVVAIGCGLRQPYVEGNYEAALFCLPAALFPALKGAIVGGAMGWTLRHLPGAISALKSGVKQ